MSLRQRIFFSFFFFSVFVYLQVSWGVLSEIPCNEELQSVTPPSFSLPGVFSVLVPLPDTFKRTIFLVTSKARSVSLCLTGSGRSSQ